MGNINCEKMIRYLKNCILFFAFLLPFEAIEAQNDGSLFMLPDNYQAQILNPSYFNDEGIILALPGFAGLSLSNEGNFRLTDLAHTNSTGQMIYDLGHFSENGPSINRNSIHFSLPLLYVGVPVRDGMISFYLQERVNTSFKIPMNSIAMINNGNLSEEYHNFHSGNIDSKILGFHELALGYARRLNDKLRFGVRGKLLFGEMFFQMNNWNLSLETSPDGNETRFTSQGSGLGSIPFPLILDSKNRFQDIEVKNIIANYLSVRNPGLAFDGGITIDLSEKRQFSASVIDLGLIFFSNKSWDFYQNYTYDFHGIDISNSTNSKLGTDEYVSPFYVMNSLKDSLKNGISPTFNSSQFLRGPAPQIFLHYQNKYTESFIFGFTNHTVLQKTYLLNTLSFNALKQFGNFSIVGDASLHGLSNITLGGGLQWNIPFAQLFVFTNNFLAIYHPAAQKYYAISFGLNFLLKESNGKTRREHSREGEFSKYLPFYKKYQ